VCCVFVCVLICVQEKERRVVLELNARQLHVHHAPDNTAWQGTLLAIACLFFNPASTK